MTEEITRDEAMGNFVLGQLITQFESRIGDVLREHIDRPIDEIKEVAVATACELMEEAREAGLLEEDTLNVNVTEEEVFGEPTFRVTLSWSDDD